MAQIDFAVAFVVIFSMIVYSVFIVSSTITKDFNYFTAKEIEKSQDSLLKQLFETLDDKSLIYNFKKIQILFEEIGGYSHIENLKISIKPIMSKIHVYNQSMNEIPSLTFTTGSYVNITFDLGFLTSQKRYVNIFYFGDKTDEILYNNNITETNVTARILSEEDVIVFSQEKCNFLKSLTYEEVKNNFGFINNFRLDNYCIYGEKSPFAANIIVKSVPLLVEKQDETIYPDYITLEVW